MFLNKQSFIYLILIIFSVYCTEILAADCDVYKSIVVNDFIYESMLKKVNNNCCQLDDYYVGCDGQKNIVIAYFPHVPECGVSCLFEKLVNLPKLQSLTVTMNKDADIPSSIGKLTQIKKLKISYPFFFEGHGIASEIGNLVNLEELDLNGGTFSGKIPSSLGKLVNLKRLDLGENHLEGYVPYEFKNLKNLQYLNLYRNILNGFVPPLPNLSSCNVDSNDGMCYLKSSNCRSNLNECTLDQIKTTNKNNGNPNPNSGEFENEKEIIQPTNGNTSDNTSNTSNDNSSENNYNNVETNSNIGSNSRGVDNENGNKEKKNSFLTTFIIVMAVGVVIVAGIFIATYLMGNRKPKFKKYENNSNSNNNINNSNNSNNVISGDPADDIEINNINNNSMYTTTNTSAAAQPSAVNGYNYVPIPSPAMSSAQAQATPNGYSVYYPVPSPVPSATQPSAYIPPSPATSFAVPTQPEVAYISPNQALQQPSTYASLQPPTYVLQQPSTYTPPQPNISIDANPMTNPPTETQPQQQSVLEYPLPPPILEEHHLPDEELPPYESLNRSLRQRE